MNTNLALVVSTRFETVNCCVCGVVMAIPDNYNQERLGDHKSFYCLNGHSQSYTGKTEAEKLREQLEATEKKLQFERERAATNFAARERAEKKLKRIEHRTSKGACPCCNRTFVALGRHMKTKHPDFVAEAAQKL